MSIAPKTVREQVTNQIRDELVSGRFEAGTMLRETELANRFGVSRGPIRDAFIQLSYEGYLAYHANRGVMVRHPPNPEDREFITSLRQQIEVHAIEKGLPNISDESIEKIKEALDRLKIACDGEDATAVALQDIEFHETIMIGCGAEDLVSAWRQLCSRMLLTYSRLGDYHQAYREHVKIFDSVKARKTKEAMEALRANIK
jgi:DNA-binding GntR family transcriptional regulator